MVSTVLNFRFLLLAWNKLATVVLEHMSLCSRLPISFYGSSCSGAYGSLLKEIGKNWLSLTTNFKCSLERKGKAFEDSAATITTTQGGADTIAQDEADKAATAFQKVLPLWPTIRQRWLVRIQASCTFIIGP